MSADAVHAGANGAASAAEFDTPALLGPDGRAAEPRSAKALDYTRCSGCRACSTACGSENAVRRSVTRTSVTSLDVATVNPEDHSAEKCNFIAHRLDVGVERKPARV